MKEKVQPLYKLEKQDKIIFLLFFLVFSFLLVITTDISGDTWIEDIYTCIVFVGNPIVLVYFIVFRWLKPISQIKHYFFLFLNSTVLAFILLGLQSLFFYTLIEVSPDEEFINWEDIVGSLLILFLLSSVLLGIIMLKKGSETQIKMLENENLYQSNELKILKNQIDPHFLFNNLNSLDALIDTNVEKAKPYIQRLAQLYQYILATQDEDTVNLKSELNFAEDYIYLIKERFGNNYQFEIIDERKKQQEKLVPPGAIQTVFENIVKHNNASRNNPILAEVIIQDDQLVISNNLRSKKEPITSFGIGLNNLHARYQILCHRTIEIKTDDRFTITLPLIQKLNG